MQYHPGFAVNYTRREGKRLHAYIPPCWMLSGQERKQASAQEKTTKRGWRIFRAYEAIRQGRLIS